MGADKLDMTDAAAVADVLPNLLDFVERDSERRRFGRVLRRWD